MLCHGRHDQGVPHDQPAGRRLPGGLQHQGAGQVAAGRRHRDAERSHPERPAGPVQHRGEDAGESGRGTHIHSTAPDGRDQAVGLAVGQERVVADAGEVAGAVVHRVQGAPVEAGPAFRRCEHVDSAGRGRQSRHRGWCRARRRCFRRRRRRCRSFVHCAARTPSRCGEQITARCRTGLDARRTPGGHRVFAWINEPPMRHHGGRTPARLPGRGVDNDVLGFLPLRCPGGFVMPCPIGSSPIHRTFPRLRRLWRRRPGGRSRPTWAFLGFSVSLWLRPDVLVMVYTVGPDLGRFHPAAVPWVWCSAAGCRPAISCRTSSSQVAVRSLAAGLLLRGGGRQAGFAIDNTQAGAFATNGFGDYSPRATRCSRR